MNFLGLSLVYSLSKAFILVRSGRFKNLVWPDSSFKSLLHIKYSFAQSRKVIGKSKEKKTVGTNKNNEEYKGTHDSHLNCN